MSRKPNKEPYRSILRSDPCAYCGEAGGTIDHILPTFIGGVNSWLNYTGACERCNSRKGHKSLLEFLAGRNFGETRPVMFKKSQWHAWHSQEEAKYHPYPLHNLLGIHYWTGLPVGN